MKIGIFGGSFNPPHEIHIERGLELINKHYVDKIIYVPTGSKYKYKNNLLPNKIRLEMLRIIVNKYDNLEVSDYELNGEVVYTCETLAYFKNLYKHDKIYFICGTDNLSYMDKWKNGLDILNNYKILVIERNGDSISELLKKFKDYRDNIIVADVEPKDLSSTLIREKISNGEDVSDLLDKDVYKYIKGNGLYE